ncbi:MAG TPA: hypothetical protein VGW38_29215 [Chloroflexota bacterium]|nr:hypothetical protein [Chloroflexota bacterium]
MQVEAMAAAAAFVGLFGLLGVGIFADGTYGDVTGLIAGNVGQLVAQLITIVTVAIWSLGSGYVIFALIKTTMGLIVSHKEEIEGLDLHEHGVLAYPADEPVTVETAPAYPAPTDARGVALA